MKIYTKKGDSGTTGLFGGSRVDKDDVRVECLGALDAVNSTIGLLRVKLSAEHAWQLNLHRIQKDMMDMRSDNSFELPRYSIYIRVDFGWRPGAIKREVR